MQWIADYKVIFRSDYSNNSFFWLDSNVFRNASVFETARWSGVDLDTFGATEIEFFISRLDEEKSEDDDAVPLQEMVWLHLKHEKWRFVNF